MGSVAVRAIAQNCRCMRVIQVVLIKCMMAKESDIDDLEAQQEHVLCVCEACFRISLFCDTSYRQLVLSAQLHGARKNTHATCECTAD